VVVRSSASVLADFVAPAPIRATQTSIVCQPVTYNGSPQLPCSATTTGGEGFRQAVPVVAGSDSTDAGTVTVSAHFSGSGYYGPSSASASFVILQAVPQLSGLPAHGVQGGNFVPSVDALGDLPATVASTTPSVCTVNSAGVVSLVGAGTCTLVPHAAQDTRDVAGTGAPQSLDVSPAPAPAGIVDIALSQDQNHSGVLDNPITSECNPYSAYLGDGSTIGCAPGNSSVATGWCADFVAWAWRRAGVSFIYGDGGSDINAWTASFYRWGVANGKWHAIGDGYAPQPGDAVVYGFQPEPASSGHVGIYVSGPSTSPTVVNGNWAPNYPANTESGVYTESGESSAGAQGGDLRGYVSP
jgi:hypothetical protein